MYNVYVGKHIICHWLPSGGTVPGFQRFSYFAIPWACCHSHTAQSTAWLKSEKFCGNGSTPTHKIKKRCFA